MVGSSPPTILMFSDDRAVDAHRCRRALFLHYSKFVAMSLVGQQRHFEAELGTSALPPKADIGSDGRRLHGDWISNHAPTAMKMIPAKCATRRPAGRTFSSNTRTASAAIQKRFMTPPTNSSAISAQQQPIQ
jgi:hypothetical protein